MSNRHPKTTNKERRDYRTYSEHTEAKTKD